MRYLLVCLVAGQVAGIVVADRGWLNASHVGPGLLLALAIAACRRGPLARACMAVVLALASGVLSHGASVRDADLGRIRRSRDVTLEARVCDVRRGLRSVGLVLCELVEVATPADCLVASAEPAGPPSLPHRLWLSASRGTPEAFALSALPVAARIRARVRLGRPEGLRNPGGSAWGRARRRAGLAGVARLVDPALVVRVEQNRGHWQMEPQRWLYDRRRQMAARLHELGSAGGLLAALSLGDHSGIDAGAVEQMRALGLSHLLAVSGLHLAMVMGLGYAGLRTAGVRMGWLARRVDVRSFALVGGALAATGYALQSGFEVPVRRALVFVWLLTLAWLWGRGRSTPHALGLAGCIVLATRPEALFDLGAQLSFAATANLLIARPLGLDGAGRVWRALRTSLSTSALAIGATAPILALQGLTANPAAGLFNVVAVPWTGLVLLPAAIASSVAANGPDGGATQLFIEAMASIASASLAGLESLAASFPAPPMPPPVSLLGASLAAALAICAALVPKLSLRIALVLMAMLWLRSAPPGRQGPEPPRVIALDVGQGDAILVQGRRGTILVDGGRALPGRYDLGRSVVVPALRSLGVLSLDAVVASHADLDHRGGLAHVLRTLAVAELWLPPGSGNGDGLEELVAVARQRGVPIRFVARGDDPIVLGDLRVTPLWPPRSPSSFEGSRNDGSLVLRVELGSDRLLLTGDIGATTERALLALGEDVSAEILKLSHHGSSSSSVTAFLDAVGAEVVLLSASCGGRTGLPDLRVLERLEARAAVLGWTGRDGALLLEAADGNRHRRLNRHASTRSCAPPARSAPPAVGLCPDVRDD